MFALLLIALACLFVCLFVGLFDYRLVCLSVRRLIRLFVRSFVRSFVCSLSSCLCACLLFWPVRSYVRSFVRLFVIGFCFAELPCGNAAARVRRDRIYEKTGGKGKQVDRQICHHRTVKRKEPQETTGVQIQAQEVHR